MDILIDRRIRVINIGIRRRIVNVSIRIGIVTDVKINERSSVIVN